ncbi:hypothetical protein [Leptospira yanagawae]|nr:hypothetical protein [Leptospira yanagawae]
MIEEKFRSICARNGIHTGTHGVNPSHDPNPKQDQIDGWDVISL